MIRWPMINKADLLYILSRIWLKLSQWFCKSWICEKPDNQHMIKEMDWQTRGRLTKSHFSLLKYGTITSPPLKSCLLIFLLYWLKYDFVKFCFAKWHLHLPPTTLFRRQYIMKCGTMCSFVENAWYDICL